MTGTVLHVAETVKGGVATVMNQLIQSNFNSLFIVPNSHRNSIVGSDENCFSFEDRGRGIRTLLFMVFKVFEVLREVAPSCVHLHSSFSLLLAPLVKVYDSKIGIIYQPHGVFYDPNVPRSKVKLLFVKCVERFFVSFVDVVLSISEYERNLLVDVHGDEKVLLLKNAIGGSNVEFEDDRIRSGYLFVGRLDEQKGIDALLDFWKRFGVETLDVVGEPVRSNFSYPNLDNVKFHGWLDSEELDHYYAHAKAVIVPSRWEGFGLVVIEAYRNGTPVLVSNRGALPELVEEGVTGYVFDFENMDDELNLAISDLTLSNRSGCLYEKCYKSYKLNYSLECYLSRYENLAKDIFYN